MLAEKDQIYRYEVNQYWGTGIFSPVVSNAALRLRRMRMAQSTDRTTSLYTFRRAHSVLCWYGLGYVGMFIYES